MKKVMMLIAVGVVTAGTAWLAAQEKTSDADAPTVEKLTPTTASANDGDKKDTDEVLATVGSVEVKGSDLEEMVDRLPMSIPAAQMGQVREVLLDRLVFMELTKLYLSDKDVEVTDDEYQAFVMGMEMGVRAMSRQPVSVDVLMASQGMNEEGIRTQIRLQKYGRKKIEDKQVAQFVKKHPNYFDGTTVTASHILVKIPFSASAKDAKAAREKINKIAKAIADGKSTFAEAAKNHSACPSASDGGNLGSFHFGEMDPLFSMVAYDAKKDAVSDPVRTQFGYHLIKVTRRTEGEQKLEGKQLEQAGQLARAALEARIQQDIAQAGVKTYPIKRD
ncbi:MAG: peptidylprolyl isomerase [Phycisphaerae bacterium]